MSQWLHMSQENTSVHDTNSIEKRKSISASTSMYVFRAHYSKDSTTKVVFAVFVLSQYLASLYVEINDGASSQAETSGEIRASAIVSIAKEETKPNSKKEKKTTYRTLFVIACTKVLS